MNNFIDRVAVVTGAGGGLGRSYALALAAGGARVVVNDLGTSVNGQNESHAAADAVVAEIVAAGGDAIASYDSVATRQGGSAIVETALEQYGRLDILIANAGFLRSRAFDALTDEDIDDILDVHLRSSFYVGQPAFAAMKRQGFGRILLTSSPAGAFGSPWQSAYAAAKMGVLGLSNAIALEGLSQGIRCNALLPSAITRMAHSLDRSWLDQVPHVAETLRRMTAGAPSDIGRLAPDWVVPLALYLVSEECEVTRAAFSASNGRFARVFIGVSEGWVLPSIPDLHDIAAHFGQISDNSIWHEPLNVYEESLIVQKSLRAWQGGSPPHSE